MATLTLNPDDKHLAPAEIGVHVAVVQPSGYLRIAATVAPWAVKDAVQAIRQRAALHYHKPEPVIVTRVIGTPDWEIH